MGDIVLNDLSLQAQMPNSGAAVSCFLGLVETIGAAIHLGVARAVVHAEQDLSYLPVPIADGTTWWSGDWLRDECGDRDLVAFVRSLSSKVPLGTDTQIEGELLEAILSGNCVPVGADRPCFAAAYAWAVDGVLMSAATAPVWSCSVLSCTIAQDAAPAKSINVEHASTPSHCDQIKSARSETLVELLAEPNVFIARKGEIFEALSFSPDVDVQVRRLSSRTMAAAVDRLLRMENTAVRWRKAKSIEPDYDFSWRPESEATMNVKEYRDARTFLLPSGAAAIFEWHLNVSDRHRIHFIQDGNAKTFVIGYIGDHLPTVKYN